jgi:uncharacterized peroxidase-related enzyme
MMARVRNIPSSELPAAVADVYERFCDSYGPFRNQCAVFAHVPAALNHLMSLLMELKAQGNVKRRYIEIAIVVTSQLNKCEYCVAHHRPVLEVEGLSHQGIDRLLAYEDHPELDEVDRLVVEYTALVTTSANRISDNVFERLRQHFSEAQIVELTLRVALCGFFNRFNDALQIEEEAEALAIAGENLPQHANN